MLSFKAFPRQVGGISPKPIWIYFDVNSQNTFDYSSLPRLQGSRSLSSTRNTTTKFKLRGKTTDFSFWRDVNALDNETGLSIRLRASDAPNEKEYWTFQLKFFLSFRGLRQPINEAKIDDNEQVIKNISNIKPLEEDEKSEFLEGETKNLIDEIDKEDIKVENKINDDIEVEVNRSAYSQRSYYSNNNSKKELAIKLRDLGRYFRGHNRGTMKKKDMTKEERLEYQDKLKELRRTKRQIRGNNNK
jgi:hypothetical protein